MNYCSDKIGFNNLYGGRPAIAITCGSTNRAFGTGVNSAGQLGLGNYVTRVSSFSAIPGNWSNMSCGIGHTLARSAGTTKWFGVGSDGYGQLGLGNNPGYNTYGGSGVKYNTLTALTGNWSQMACGGFFTMALSAGTNKLFSTGSNSDGQLGIGTSDTFDSQNMNLFTTPLTGNWSQVVCGRSFAMAMSAGTTKWFGTGANGYGALGLGDTVNRTVFTALTGNWSQMDCGDGFTMALSAGTNKLFGTGFNYYGQLGLGNNGFGTEKTTFTQLTGDWSQVVCGINGYAMALSAGTTKWFGTGNNTSGQLGLSNITERNVFTPLTGNWSQMVCGESHTMALSAGTVKWFATGRNTSGQLGLSNFASTSAFTLIPGNWSYMARGADYTMALSAA